MEDTRTLPTASTKLGSDRLTETKAASTRPVSVCTTVSAYLLRLLVWGFGGTLNNGRGVSLFLLPLLSLLFLLLGCLSSLDREHLVCSIVSWPVVFPCCLLYVGSFLKGNWGGSWKRGRVKVQSRGAGIWRRVNCGLDLLYDRRITFNCKKLKYNSIFSFITK